MYATDRQTDVRRVSSLNTSALWGTGHNNVNSAYTPSTTTRVVYGCGFCKRTHTKIGWTVLPAVTLCSLANVLGSLSSYGIVGSTHTVTTLRVTATAVNHLRECVRSLGIVDAVQYIRHTHVAPLLQQLHWPSVPERVNFKLCVLVHRCLYGLCPEYFRRTSGSCPRFILARDCVRPCSLVQY